MRDFVFYANSKNVFSLVVEVMKSNGSSRSFATVMLESIPHLICNDYGCVVILAYLNDKMYMWPHIASEILENRE